MVKELTSSSTLAYKVISCTSNDISWHNQSVDRFFVCNLNLPEIVAGKLSLVGNIANETILRIIKLKIRLGVLRL